MKINTEWSLQMKTLYYVTGYNWQGNEWWRFAIVAKSSEDAIEQGKQYNEKLSKWSATAICQTPDDVSIEL